MLENRAELVEMVLSIPEELATLKGNEEKLMMKPIEKVGIEINGIKYDNLRALQILQDEVKVYHSKEMIEVTFKEVKDISFY